MISRAIIDEIGKGNGIRGDKKIDDYVYLDATHIEKDIINKKLPDIAGFCRTYLGIDPAEKPIPVQPTAHYAMGGIPTDMRGRVSEMNAAMYTRDCMPQENARAFQCTERIV